MTTFPNSPRLLKNGIVLIDPDTSAVQRIIVPRYNPDTLTRRLRAKAVAPERSHGGSSVADSDSFRRRNA